MIEKPPAKRPFDKAVLYMLINPECRDAIEDINNKYLYWDKVKYKVPKGVNANDFWAAVKFSRQGRSLLFAGRRLSFFETNEMQKMLHEFDLNFGGTLLSSDIIPEKRRSYYMLSSIAEEAIASSRMEGAVTTREKAKKMIRTQAKPKDKSQKMIINNYETIEYLRKNRNANLSRDFILEIHRRISEDTLNNKEYEGRFRDNNDIFVADNVSGDIVHFPPDYADIESCIDSICDFANNDGPEFIHPIIKAIIIHFMLSYLHPFIDGNGRTARSLFYWYMMKNDYWLVQYLSISRVIKGSKRAYEKAFLYSEHDANDIGYFVKYNLDVLRKSFEELKKYLIKKYDEGKKSERLLHLGNISQRQAGILNLYIENPDLVLSSVDVMGKFGVSAGTAKSDLRDLAQKGYLREISLNGRTKGYVRSAAFREVVKLA